MPIYEFDEISEGKQFPPIRRRKRNDVWRSYNHFFNNDYREFLRMDIASEEGFDVFGEQPRLGPNICRSIVEIWRDIVIPTAPKITYPNPRVQEFIDALSDQLYSAGRVVIEDGVKYGAGVFVNRYPMAPQAIDPQWWFPVREPSDIFVEKGDIIAVPYTERNLEVPDKIRIWKYENGMLTDAKYEFSGSGIQSMIGEPLGSKVGIHSVVPVTLDESTIYGVSGFTDVVPYIQELFRRESKVSEALDRQASPHLVLPSDLVDSEMEISPEGSVLPLQQGDPIPQYVTWDASFSEQSEAMDRAMGRIYWLSRIAPILVDQEGSLNVPSGAALRRLVVLTTARARAWRAVLQEGMRKTIVGNASLVAVQGGEILNIDPKLINFEWSELFDVAEDEAIQEALNEDLETESMVV